MRLLAVAAMLIFFGIDMGPAFAIPLAAVACVLIASDLFLMDERGRLDILYATLPVGRTTVVLGRYTTVLLEFLVAAVIGNTVAMLDVDFGRAPLGPGMLVMMNVVGFVIVAVGLAVQLPAFFALGYTKARFVGLVPPVVIAVAGLSVGRKADILQGLAAIVRGRGVSVPLEAAAVAGCVIVLAASVLAARALYVRRRL
ncbi:MAG TPA: ABC-2 transporter permease [Microbacteriaceae bacterium]|nr:ABC-2 transporter permease [Microbacteriaceae bacterium]